MLRPRSLARAFVLASIGALISVGVMHASKLSAPTPGAHEPEWSVWLAGIKGGKAEYRLPDKTRADIFIETSVRGPARVYEVEWAPKWYEAIGQCQHYKHQLVRVGRVLPGVILLAKPGQERHINNCRRVCEDLEILFEVVYIVEATKIENTVRDEPASKRPGP